MRLVDDIQVKSNLKLTARERGKIVARYEGHNIFLDLGREWLSGLISYASLSPDTAQRDDRIKYIGFGIGGSSQLATTKVAAAPYSTIYSGTNSQTDTDPSVTGLERPVRLSGSGDAYPGQASDVWLGTLQAPPSNLYPNERVFKRVITEAEINYSPFDSVPLSEVALYTSAADPLIYNNTAVAYDTFETVSKTGAIALEIEWTLRF